MSDLKAKRDAEVARSGGRRLPPKFTAKVVGVSFVAGYPDNLHELDRMVNGVQFGGELPTVILRRNPDNKFDANAIEVHVPALGDHAMIGRLERPIAARLAPELDAGGQWVAGIESVLINPDHMDRPGISVTMQRVKEDADV